MREQNDDTFYMLREDDVAWMSQDGRVSLIDEMEMTHLINTVELIRRKNKRLSGSKFIIPKRMLERLADLKDNYPEFFI